MHSRRRLLSLSMLSVILAGALAAGTAPEPGVTTPLGEPEACTGDVRDQVTRAPQIAIAPPLRLAAPARPMEGGVAIDSLETQLFVLPGKESVIAFDHQSESLSDTLAPYALTPTAWEAIAISPAWVREDLEWKLHLLSTESQDRIGNFILGISDPRILDEVAFQAAHMTHVLLNFVGWDENIMRVNAEFMYQIDPELQYVDIVDYDLGDGNFYSTTCYRVVEGSDTVTVEIPPEIYYWYIVMPKVSDEKPDMSSTVYDHFWREYLYYYNDAGYPLLRDVMQPLTVLWDHQQHDWGGGRAFTPTVLAVDAVGNWCSETVPYAAEGDRPIQPNIIAHGHNGNCGELQDLLCAAARTCLIPCVCTMDILEDHVWCEMSFDGWQPYQVDLGRGPTHIANPGIAYDVDHGGGKDDSCIWDWRADGWTWDAIATYSQVCTLTVHLEDPQGVPIDNGTVTIASESYYPPYSRGIGRFGETDQAGNIQFILGNNQNYYVKVTTLLGNFPAAGYSPIISGSLAGEHYYWEWAPSNTMTQLQMTEGTPVTYAEYVLEVEYDLPYDQKYGKDAYATPVSYYAYPIPNGQLQFFIVDHANLLNYIARQPFTAYAIAEGASSNHVYFEVPEARDYYVVLSGAEHLGLSTWAEMKVRLWSRAAGVPEAGAGEWCINVAPNPSRGPLTLRFASPQAGDLALRVFDATGREVRSWTQTLAHPGEQALIWDGADGRGRALPSGTYFVRLEGAGLTRVHRVTMVR
jgi:hypothetical protein